MLMTDDAHDIETLGPGLSRLKLKRLPERMYYSIAEVSEETQLKPYVLRFWEKEFPMLHPKKNRAGKRTYQRKDIEVLLRIKHLLYKEGYTIDGARTRLRSDMGGDVDPPESLKTRQMLGNIRKELEAIAALLP